MNFSWGRKNKKFLFNICDLIFLEDAFVIISFYKIGDYKVYVNFILISDNMVGEEAIRNFNLNSSNDDVYIEFGEPGLQARMLRLD